MPSSAGTTAPLAPDGSVIDPKRFGAAVDRALRKKNMSGAELGRAVGLDRATISRIRNGKQVPDRDNAQRILDALGLDWNDVTRPSAHATGERPGEQSTASKAEPSADVVYVPRNGFAGAGPPYHNRPPEEPEHDAYPRFELLRLTGMNPEMLRSAVIVGDSHAPEIPPNTRVLYAPVERFLGPGLYVITINEAEQVRKVQQLADGTLLLIPTNPTYRTEELTPIEEADTPNTYRTAEGRTAVVRCVGKVVFYPKPA